MKYSEYRERFKKMDIDELVVSFYHQVGNPGWTSSRANYIAALRQEFIDRGFDYSNIGKKIIV